MITPDGTMLMLNTGSSSVKFKLFANTGELTVLANGKIHSLGSSSCAFTVSTENNSDEHEQPLPADTDADTALKYILDWLDKNTKRWRLQAVAHRIVHGGTLFTKSLRLNADVLKRLKTLIPLAPLHQPHNLAAIELIAATKPNVPQFACFDTAFHAHQGDLFTTYALPQALREKGVRKYGFHGLSYEWISHVLQKKEPRLAKGRIVAAHLGNGSSLCAIKNGISVDTTMGMTALAGLPMGSRCGDLDPGAVLYMIRELSLTPTEVEAILYEQSGLLALSSCTNNVKLLEDSEDKKARFALSFYCQQIAKYIAMMAAAVGGMDAIVFTGGVGENSAFVRNKVIELLDFMQPFAVRIIPADEEKIMAMHTCELLSSPSSSD